MGLFSFYGEAGKGQKTIEYSMTIAGTVLMAIATIWYFDAMEIVTGGVTGVGIILRNTIGVPLWIVNLVANIPLFIAGAKSLGKVTLTKTVVGTISLTVLLGTIGRVDLLTGDKLVDIICGSVLMGVGHGFIFRSYASSGGTDLLATIINRKIRHLSIPRILAFVDGVIVLLGISAFGIKNGVYALIAVVIISRVSDMVVEGPNHAKLMFIISDESEKLSEYIFTIIKRGVTYIDITGAYTKTRRNMVMSVVSTKEMAKIKQILYQIDPKAICFVGDIREAFGEGFTKFRV